MRKKTKKPAAVAAANGLRDASFSDAAPTTKTDASPQGAVQGAPGSRSVNLRALNDAANGVFEHRIIDFPGLLELTMLEDLEARMIVKSIGQWLGTQNGNEQLCFTCTAVTFSRSHQPAGFVVSLPFANRSGVFVNGLCDSCLVRANLAERIIDALRKIWPNLTRFEKGGAA
jgi:hypothetical protein